jgi:multiple sugar transport system substrate-binding protein
MRTRTVIFAAALLMAPLGARATDLVVWWEEGFYPQADEAIAETISAFEQKTGKHVELVLHDQYEMNDQAQTALKTGSPPDFMYSTLGDLTARWAYEDQLADLKDALGPVLNLFDPHLLERNTFLNGRTGQRGLYGLPMGRRSNHLHVWVSLLERAGLSLDDIPKEWEAFWSFWCNRCSRQCAMLWAATISGAPGWPCPP